MSLVPPTIPLPAPVPVQPLEYRRASDTDRAAEPTLTRQFWLGVGLFVAYLAWSYLLIFLPRFFSFEYIRLYYFAYRFISVLPLLAVTIYVMRAKNWGPSAVAALLIAGWVVACSGSGRRPYDLVGTFWTMVPPIGAAIYLLAIGRYRGVAAGLLVALGLLVVGGGGSLYVIARMMGG